MRVEILLGDQIDLTDEGQVLGDIRIDEGSKVRHRDKLLGHLGRIPFEFNRLLGGVHLCGGRGCGRVAQAELGLELIDVDGRVDLPLTPNIQDPHHRLSHPVIPVSKE